MSSQGSDTVFTACGEDVANPMLPPVCPVFGQCGACSLLDVPYQEQLEIKQNSVVELFGNMALADAFQPIMGMADPYHYRNKVISPYVRDRGARARGGNNARNRKAASKRDTRKGQPAASILTGMYAKGTHRLIPSDACLVENEQAKQVTLAIRDIMQRYRMEPYNEDTGEGFVRHAVIRVGHESNEVLVTLVTNGEEFASSKAFCRELVRRCPQVTTVVQNINERKTNIILGDRERTLYGPGFILDTLCGLSFRISSHSFYQVNSAQTAVLYDAALALADVQPGERVVDAYCGTGTIGLVAAKRAPGSLVIGVDNNGSAINDARQNARHNGIENAQFIREDAGAYLRACEEDVEVLIMDPPRTGSTKEFLDAVLRLRPERVVYISCNPTTQVRDVELLLDGGYVISRIQPVDMFPHTDHIENICLLKQNEPK